MFSWKRPDSKWHTVLILFLLVVSGYVLSGCGGTKDPETTELVASDRASVINIYTELAGVHYFGIDDLEKLNVILVPEDYGKIHLRLRGESQPLWIIAEGEATFLFYGQASESRYVKNNVYQLSIEDNNSDTTYIIDKSQISSSPISATEDSSYQQILRMEVDEVYTPQVTDGDHWFWYHLAAAEEQAFEFSVNHLTQGVGKVTVSVWGNADINVSPDHHIKILVNGEEILDHAWDGSGWHGLEANIRNGLLVAGNNTLIIKSPGDTGAIAENIYVDWVEVAYAREPVADKGVLVFNGMAESLLLSGFNEEVMIFDVTDNEQVFLIGQYQPNREGISFIGEKGHDYYAVEQAGWLQTKKMSVSQGLSEDSSLINGVDYLAVGNVDLLRELDPLLAQRQAQGLKTGTVTLEQIYDQFNYGFAEPEAIQSFLRYVVNHWNPVPRYVLLVGDYTYDPLGNISDPPEYSLPTFFVQTMHGGETASDVMFAILDEDDLPGVAVGRIPARNASQLGDWVKKLVQYEQARSTEDIEKKVVAVADGQEPSFQLEAERFLGLFYPPFETELITSTPGDDNTSGQVSEAISSDAYLVSYFGHGSITMWGKDRILTVDDVESLTQPPTQIMVQMTCLTGFFTHPEINSLTEELIFHPEGGALAILAPTSLTLPFGQSKFSQPLGYALSQDEFSRLGDAFLYAQREVNLDEIGAQDVLFTFLLFGDPAQLLY